MFTDKNGRLAFKMTDDGSMETVKIERRGIEDFPEQKKLVCVKTKIENEQVVPEKKPNFFRRFVQELGF